jgi:hypothetical protein
MNSNDYLRPEDHAEAQRLQALADAAAGSDDEERGERRLPETTDERIDFLQRKMRVVLASGGRRRNYLVRLIEDRGSRSPGGHDYDRAELAFVEYGLAALRWWKRNARLLEEAIEVLRTVCDMETPMTDGDVRRLAEMAREVLDRAEP